MVLIMLFKNRHNNRTTPSLKMIIKQKPALIFELMFEGKQAGYVGK